MNVFYLIGIVFFVFSMISFVLYMIFVVKKERDLKKCLEKTSGTVIGHKMTKTRIPVVKYIVEGKEYKVFGPLFSSYSVVVTYTNGILLNNPMEYYTNVTSRDNLPDKYVVKAHVNNRRILTGEDVLPIPLMDLFPEGTTVDVYYDKSNPKKSYVQRPNKVGTWLKVLLLSLMIFFLIVSVGMFYVGMI